MKSSKIEQEKALELIRKKYPKAEFWYSEDDGKYNIAFYGANSRTYSYSCINTLHFLQRLKIVNDNVVYKKDFNARKKKIEHLKERLILLKSGEELVFFETVEDAIIRIQKEIEKEQEHLDKLIILDI